MPLSRLTMTHITLTCSLVPSPMQALGLIIKLKMQSSGCAKVVVRFRECFNYLCGLLRFIFVSPPGLDAVKSYSQHWVASLRSSERRFHSAVMLMQQQLIWFAP
mmetsp:Transcript_44160/g.79271  ORF Transcript_44160/g.79271 Transcript_44160/m.79271 type:complete len:104 (+) Transcript_44160:1275-1586(+)